MSSWQPLLPEPLAERALGVVEEIAQALATLPPEPQQSPADQVSLASGLAGRALFLAYLDRALPGAGWGDRAVDILEQATTELADLSAKLSLYWGFPGVAWVLEHLQSWLLDASDDPGEEIATAVVERSLGGAPWIRVRPPPEA